MIDASLSTPDRPFVKASWRPWFHSYTQAHHRGVQWKGLRPSQVFFCSRHAGPGRDRSFLPSAHRWWTASPARFEHRVPGFDGVVPQHPSPGLRHRRVGRDPVVSAHRHLLGMNGGCIWLELHHLLLLCAHQPAFSAGLFWWFVGGAVTGQGVGRRQHRRQLCKASAAEATPRQHDGEFAA